MSIFTTTRSRIEDLVTRFTVLPTLSPESTESADATPTIGTHNGSFHCDEVLACFLLKRGVPRFHDAVIVRTRDRDTLARCTALVDVGGVYDAAALRLDHHQSTFQDSLGPGYTTRLSSAGLVYKHFGREIIRQIIETAPIPNGVPSDSPTAESTAAAEPAAKVARASISDAHVDLLYKMIYDGFVHSIDAIDNGVSVCDPPARYRVTTDLSARVSLHAPAWYEASTPELENARFLDAMAMAGTEFETRVLSLRYGWLPARSVVERAFAGRAQWDGRGRIVVLDQQCAWKEHLYQIEREEGVAGSVRYVLYTTGDSIRVQAVSDESDGFRSRLPLPKVWCGVRDADLEGVCGIPGAVFVHASGFIGGCKTMEGALRMAQQALELSPEEQ